MTTLRTIVNGPQSDASDINQYKDLLTGVMTGQDVSLAGALSVSKAIAYGGTGPPLNNAARLQGAMSSTGPPGSGTWSAMDMALDVNGVLWVCVTGGTPGTWIPVNGADRFFCNVYLNATTVAWNGWASPVPLDTIASGGDPNGNFSTSTHLYTTPIPGRYEVQINAQGNSTSGNHGGILGILKNGTEVQRGPSLSETTGTTGMVLSLGMTADIPCAAGDTIGFQAYSILSQRFNGGTLGTWMKVRYVGK